VSRGWREVAIGVGAYGAYLLVRQVVWTPEGRARAAANATRVDATEQRWRIAIERSVQRFVLRAPRLIDLLNASYAAANVALSVGWLVLLHHRDDGDFLTERRAALIAFAGALPVFALAPVAPPRTLPGFVDTMAERGLDLDHPLLTRLYNPIAAMPSHHVAFATVTGLGLARRSRSRWIRAGCRAYPAGVALVVVATANHFVSDVAAGAVLGLVARKVAR